MADDNNNNSNNNSHVQFTRGDDENGPLADENGSPLLAAICDAVGSAVPQAPPSPPPAVPIARSLENLDNPSHLVFAGFFKNVDKPIQAPNHLAMVDLALMTFVL